LVKAAIKTPARQTNDSCSSRWC